MYAGASVVFRSEDAGETWTVTNNSTMLDDGNPVITMAASAYDARVVYAATSPLYQRSSVFITRDAGESWQKITTGLPDRFPTDIFIDPGDHNIAYLSFAGFGSPHLFRTLNGGLYLGNDLGIFTSTDGGTTWQAWSEGLPDAVFAMDLSISPANKSLRVATHGNGVFERPLLSTDPELQTPDMPGTTRLRFYLPQAGKSSLHIYDITGRLVAELLNQELPEGWHDTTWNGKNSAGLNAGNGLYLYILRHGSSVLSGKLMLLR